MSYYRQPPHRGAGTTIAVPPLTPVVRAIIIACAAIWLAQFVIGPVLRVGWSPTAIFGLNPMDVRGGAIWQPFTYMWLHSEHGPMHLLLNMLMVWMVGGELERYWGGRQFFIYYLVCGIGAGLIALIVGLFQGQAVSTVGASGAVYGLFVAFGKIFAERTILFMMIFPMRARTFAWILTAVAFVGTLGYSATGVSHIAHLGGAAVGWLYLNRAWRVGALWRELRWRLRRRRFKVMSSDKDDDQTWIH